MADDVGYQPRVLRSFEGSNHVELPTKGRLHKVFPSLADLSKGVIICWLQELAIRSSNTFWYNAAKYRDFLDEYLVSHLRQSLLDLIIQLVRTMHSTLYVKYIIKRVFLISKNP